MNYYKRADTSGGAMKSNIPLDIYFDLLTGVASAMPIILTGKMCRKLRKTYSLSRPQQIK